MIEFLVATNFQDELLHLLSRECRSKITLYGKFGMDPFGGGRSGYTLPGVSIRTFRRHLALAREYGFGFNYLLNSTCLDNLENEPVFRSKLLSFVEMLAGFGISEFTVASPSVATMLRKNFKKITLVSGSFALAGSIQRIERLEKYGFDAITLDNNRNRDIEFLKEARKVVRPGTKLHLIANLACLFACPMVSYHSNLASHSSQTEHSSGGFVLDYCGLRCQLLRAVSPLRFLCSPWIHPASIDNYIALGYNSFKIVERNKSTRLLVSIVKSYEERRFLSDVEDFFGPFTRRSEMTGGGLRGAIRYLARPSRVSILKLWKSKDAFQLGCLPFEPEMEKDPSSLYSREDCRLGRCERCSRWSGSEHNQKMLARLKKEMEKRGRVTAELASLMLDGRVFEGL